MQCHVPVSFRSHWPMYNAPSSPKYTCVCCGSRSLTIRESTACGFFHPTLVPFFQRYPPLSLHSLLFKHINTNTHTHTLARIVRKFYQSDDSDWKRKIPTLELFHVQFGLCVFDGAVHDSKYTSYLNSSTFRNCQTVNSSFFLFFLLFLALYFNSIWNSRNSISFRKAVSSIFLFTPHRCHTAHTYSCRIWIHCPTGWHFMYYTTSRE